MPAYVINDMVVTDPEMFERYKQLSPPTVAQYGGRFLARGGQIENLEGDWSPRRVVIRPTSTTSRTCRPSWQWRHKMKSLVRPELPTGSVASSQAPTAAVDNSAPSASCPQST